MSRRILSVAALASLMTVGMVGDTPAKPRRAFPVTIKAANGRVTIKHRPRRVISLSPTATETLFAIGAGRQVIAVDDQSNYPARAPQTKLSGYRPNAEAVARYRPDLVITPTTANKLLPALRKLHIPVLLNLSANHLSGAYEQIKDIGTATGNPRRAAALIRSMRRRIAAAVRSVPRRPSLSVFHELSPDFFSATSHTFIGRVYKLFGLRNIADRAKGAGDYPQLSGEYVLAANPDLIVLSDTKCCKQSIASVRKRPGWRSIKAVKRGQVLPVSDDVASRWGPRLVGFVEFIARALRRARS
jgi:iron complex transport system substrate-binding protein